MAPDEKGLLQKNFSWLSRRCPSTEVGTYLNVLYEEVDMHVFGFESLIGDDDDLSGSSSSSSSSSWMLKKLVKREPDLELDAEGETIRSAMMDFGRQRLECIRKPIASSLGKNHVWRERTIELRDGFSTSDYYHYYRNDGRRMSISSNSSSSANSSSEDIMNSNNN